MKPYSFINRSVARQLCWLALAVFCQAAVPEVRAGNPTISGPGTINIDDTATPTSLFSTATVAAGSGGTTTNWLTVSFSFAASPLGSLTKPAAASLAGTTYSIGPTDAASAESILRQFTFTPVANYIPVPNTSNVVFSVNVLDVSNNAATPYGLTLAVTATNNSPVLSASGVTNITDKATANPFLHVLVTDVDNSGAQPQTVTVTLASTNTGFLLIPTNGVGTNWSLGNNFVYTLANVAPSAVSNAISTLVYQPIENTLPAGTYDTNTFTISDFDGWATVSSSSVKVVVYSTNDVPTIQGLSLGGNFPVLTGPPLTLFGSPLSQVTLNDVDHNDSLTNNNGQSLIWHVVLTGTNVLGQLTYNNQPVGSSYAGTNEASLASTVLHGLNYLPPTANLSPGTTNSMTITISADDQHGGKATNTITLVLSSSVLSPDLSGTQSGQTVNDNSTIAPFSTVIIHGNNGDAVTVQVQLSGAGITNDIQGLFINPGSFTRTAVSNQASIYSISGSGEAVTAAIESLIFQPTANRIKGGTTETAIFKITIIDSGIPYSDSSTFISIAPVNDAPQIFGVSPLITIYDDSSAAPFSSVLVSDVDENGQQVNQLTINLDNAAKGVLTTNNVAVTTVSNGVYTISGTPAALTTAIRQLVFKPTSGRVPFGQTETTTFTILLNDGFGGITANNATAVRSISANGLPIVIPPQPQPHSLAITSNSVFAFQGVTISDPTQLKVGLRINNPAQGSFTTNSLAANGVANQGGGYYYLTGAASNVMTAIQQLAFVPATNLPFGAVINFTISVTNALPNYVVVNHAIVLRSLRTSYIVTQTGDYDPTSTNVVPGTLRDAIAHARSGDHITFDIRATATNLPAYPAAITLTSPIVLNSDIVFDGPGADQLTICGDTNVSGGVQLFTVNANATMNRLAFANGHASFAGGAFEVTLTGSLNLSYCALNNCQADFWGGAVDVDGGVLSVDHCFFQGNHTSSSVGQGGGAVSLYTDLACSFANTTFATNHQDAVGGLGGGALYAEDLDPGTEFDVYVLNCTFHDNVDAAGHGSSIRPNVFNTFVLVQNTIVADGRGKNIEMDQSGAVISLGGNISDDNTHSIFSAGGASQDNFIFTPPLDQTNILATSLIAALANNQGPTLTYAVLPAGNAVNKGLASAPAASVLGTDQRGYFRSGTADVGAFELNASQRLIIEEIGMNPANGVDQFIEFYVPRDSAALDVANLQVFVDGVWRHTFASQVLQPGQALVLCSSNATTNVTGTVVFSQIAVTNLALQAEGGLISVVNPAGQTVFTADYVGAFVSSDTNESQYLSAANQTIMLSPQFQGVFLPFQLTANASGLTNVTWKGPGYFADGLKPLNGGNAPPSAYPDLSATDAHTVISAIPVLANDIDPDITDTLHVVWVGTNGPVSVTNLIGFSQLGAMVTIVSNGASISYDPTVSPILQALPQGVITNDSFQYTILDYSNNIAQHYRGTNDTDTTSATYLNNLAKATATVGVIVIGVNTAPAPQNDGTNTAAILTTAENAVLDFTTANNILSNDTDVNSDDVNTNINIIAINATNGFVPYLSTITTALGATVTLDIRFDRNQAHITYNPTNSAILRALNWNQATNDTFYYSVQDSHGAIGTAAIKITVTGVDNAPVANPDSLTTDENTPLTVPHAFFLANDTDVDNGHILTITSVSPTSAYGASVTLVGTNLVYNPTVSTNILNALARKEFLTDTFTYTITDDNNLTSTTNVTVLVTGVNDAPIAQADFYTTNEDSLLTISAANGVLANDHDPDTHDLIRVIPFTTNTLTSCYATNGGAPMTMNANGSFTLDPRGAFDWLKQGEIYNDTFSYVVMDHSLSVASDDNFSVNMSTSNNVLPVLANDVVLSAVGGAFTVVGVSAPDHGGTVSINASNNALIYTPAAGYVGPETFTYTNADGLGGGDWAKVSVTVAGSVLYAVNDAFTVAKGTTNSLNLLANDVIIPATGANVSIVGLIASNLNGTVTLNGTGPNNSVNYTPGISAPYTETFGYIIASGSLMATGSVTVAVLDRSGSLPSGKDIFTLLAGSANNPLNVLANDFILPGSSSNLFLTGFDSVSNLTGTVVKNNTGTRLLYTPQSGVTSEAGCLTYYFADGLGGSGSNKLNIQVVSGGFFANDDNFVLYKNSTNTLAVMVNDVILPNLGQTLYISDIGIGTNAPTHGSVTINGAGTGLIYVPTNGYASSDDFTYEITDGSPSRAQGHVHVTILDNSRIPSNPDCYRVARESANNSLPVLANDYSLPLESGPFSIVGLVTNGVHATIAITGTNSNNTLLYTPNAGFIGRDSFSYIFADSNGNQGTNFVAVTVGSLVPRDDLFNVVSGSANNVLDVRANDISFPDTNALRKIYGLVTNGCLGSVTVNSNATLVLYSPTNGFTGVEKFSYQLADDTTNLFTASVTINVVRAGSDRATNLVTVAIVGVNDIPTITGAQSGFHIDDKHTVQPFTNVVIGDLDECGFQTNTVTVSLDAAVKGTLTNLGGFANIAPGVYQMKDSPPNITASLKTLVFVPTENRIIVPTSELTTFTITADDGYVTAPVTNSTTTVLVDSVNDAPVISGAQGGFQINDKQTVQPFTNVVITEVDDSTTQSLNVHISLDLAAKGVLQNLGSFTNAGNGVYAMQGTAANVTASLQTLVFMPTENRITVPTTETTTFTISVNDGFTPAPVTNSDTTVFVTATNDPSTIVGTQGGYQINDKQTVMPFTNVVIADVDDLTLQPLNVTVALDLAAKGVLQNLGGFTNSAPGIYTMIGVATNVTASVRNLVFRPTENRIIVPTSEVTTLTILVDDGFQYPLITNADTTITVTATNDAPTIAGTATNNITDKQTVQPFSTVTIGDVDNLAAAPPQPQTLTVRIVMDNLDKGSLQSLGGFTVVSNGVFQLTGFAPAVTSAIRGIWFVPVNNHIVVPTPAAIHFGISVSDGFMTAPTTNLAVVNVTPINDPPIITGTVAGQVVYDRLSLNPFAGVLITEVDNDTTQALRCTITLDSASKGVLTSLGGFTNVGGGVYSFGTSNGTITAAMITTALRGLVFTPTTANRVTPGSPETTRFTLRVDDFFAPTVVDTNTTVIAYDPLNALVMASDKTAGAQFGAAVATLRDLAVVGAPNDSVVYTSGGSVYLYARSLDGSNTWTQVKKIYASDASANDHFGTAVAISGDLLVVGSPFAAGKVSSSGAAYVYGRNQGGTNQWGFVKKISASDGSINDQFGGTISISNTLVAVGAPHGIVGGVNAAGAVYLFDQNQTGPGQWGLVKKLTLANAATSDAFGSSVSLSGDNLVVGAPLVDLTNAVNGGATFIYSRNLTGSNQWGLVKKLTLASAAINDQFGTSVSLSGDNLVAAAPYLDLPGTTDSGAAYVFSRNQGGAEQWGLVKQLALTNPVTADHFGSSVAMDADTIVVGVPQQDGTNGVDYGAAYLFKQNQGGSNVWGQVDKLLPATVGQNDYFGCAVAISQNTVAGGAYNSSGIGQHYGNAYMFRIFYDNAPELLLPVANQSLVVGVPFTFTMPAGAFADPDIGDMLAYGITGNPLPAWLNFDPLTGIFSGTPTAVGYYYINLAATDIYGTSTTNQFLITVTTTNQPNFNLLSARAVTASHNKVLAMNFTGMPGSSYRLQQTTNLINAIWTDVSTQVPDVNGLISVSVTNPPSTVFYRMVTP